MYRRWASVHCAFNVTIRDEQAALQFVTDVTPVGHLQAVSLAVVVHVIESRPIVHDRRVMIAVI
ncbi:hypothetical protein [Pseudomonas sp. FP1740]|uniref:hypothetical protein n=1 Tax=Pseudomonas sp. FP1740 TaxID=2954078 RepID=UPI0027358F51|nr:hypothetical protein [Pseudomonas sp. FP1740]WLG48033.1 hypothetical protein PSH69_20200 [Pseudomonas sp. FP1740]